MFRFTEGGDAVCMFMLRDCGSGAWGVIADSMSAVREVMMSSPSSSLSSWSFEEDEGVRLGRESSSWIGLGGGSVLCEDGGHGRAEVGGGEEGW